MEATNVARPRHLREALGLAFVHRGRIRWRAGKSGFLGLEYPGEGEGFIVDVADVPDFREIQSDRHGLQIGAFADIERVAQEPLIRSALGDTPFGPDAARFRLGALGAQVIIAGMGSTRVAGLDTLATRELPANEIPLAVTLKAELPKVAFADRRIRRRDGVATFELRVFVALVLSGVHRIGTATVAYMLDGAPPVPLSAVADPLAGAMIAKGTFAGAARHAADAFRGDDEKTNVLRRTIIPLVLSALKEAYDASRADWPQAKRQGFAAANPVRRNTRR
jgi:CO/xanthine dehydrogenase FAD-binding subunit